MISVLENGSRYCQKCLIDSYGLIVMECLIDSYGLKNVWLIGMDSFVNNCIAGKLYWSWLVIIFSVTCNSLLHCLNY